MAKKGTVAGTTLDPTIQFSTITLDGKDYKLAWSFNALATAEGLTGLNLLSGLGAMVSGTQSVSQVRALFYASLLTAQPKMTLEDAGALIRLDTVTDIVAAIATAWANSMPTEKKRPEDEAESEPATTRE